MRVPQEFEPAAIAAASQDASFAYAAALASGEPYRSINKHNPWLRPPKAREALEWGKGW